MSPTRTPTSAPEPEPLFLGLDLSTQQLKAIIISEDLTVVHESAVHFDKDLPAYGTTNGAIRGLEGEVTSPVRMWLEAMDLLMEKMKAAGVDFNAIQAISGAGQQHGSVYWSEEGDAALAALNSDEPLVDQLSPKAFSIPNAPIWQDSSTTRECRELEEAVGGPQVLADLTGSRAYERFTGPQISRVHPPFEPSVQIDYADISRFVLHSIAVLGHIAPIEVSDASGMNLMDVLTCKWDDKLLEACGGPELRSKLGPEPVHGGTVLGTIAGWWTKRWGFNPECIIAPFTGDNPASVVALSVPGDAILSLGTSTTFLLSIPPAETAPKRFTTSHLLSHPTTFDAQIAMLCYKNGALAREQIRDRYASGDWTRFNSLVEGSSPGNDGHMGLYFPLPEIILPNVQGDFLFSVAPNRKSVEAMEEEAFPVTAHPRAILESQFLSIRSRIAAILPADAPPLQRLVLTGGSSANTTIRQLAADLFEMSVYIAEGSKEAAGMGGAFLAKYAWWKRQTGGTGTFEEMSLGEVSRMKLVAEPRKEIGQLYEGLVEVYRACEEQVVSTSVAA